VNDGRLMTLSEISGFVMEGRKRQAVWMDSRWEDSLTMGILRDEWERQH
jgi:RimJ/RimL family protein N-acetyltransferase